MKSIIPQFPNLIGPPALQQDPNNLNNVNITPDQINQALEVIQQNNQNPQPKNDP